MWNVLYFDELQRQGLIAAGEACSQLNGIDFHDSTEVPARTKISKSVLRHCERLLFVAFACELVRFLLLLLVL